MTRRSPIYRVLLAVGILAGLGVAGFFAWKLFKKETLVEALALGEESYRTGVAALDAKDGPGAIASFDAAITRADGLLKKFDELQGVGKLKPEELAGIEAGRGRTNWLKSRALRDRAYAKALSDGTPIPETLDTTTKETYRSFVVVRDEEQRNASLNALFNAAQRLPKDPDIHKEAFRVILSIDPIPWAEAARQSRIALEFNPADSRALYLLARVEFDQFDEKNQPKPMPDRDPDRVQKASEYLALSKKGGSLPVWRGLDLETRIARWLATQPAARKLGGDPAAEFARVSELLFDSKTGALARAASREAFDALSKLDAIGLMNLHGLAIAAAVEDSKDKTRLASALRAELAVASALAEHPFRALWAAEVNDGLSTAAMVARPEAEKLDRATWRAFVKDLDAFCAKESGLKACGPAPAARLAEIYQADADADPATRLASEKHAIDWYEVAARAGKATPDLQATIHANLLELRFAAGASDADLKSNLDALKAANSPKGQAAAAFFAGVSADRGGRFAEALAHFGQAAAVPNGGEYGLRGFAALPGLAFLMGKPNEAASNARDFDRVWDQVATQSRHGKAWVASRIASRDELSALQAASYYALAHQRAERELRDKPGKPVPAEVTKPFEQNAERVTQKLPPKSAAFLLAHAAQLEFLAVAGRTAEAKAIADLLKVDFPNSADALRAEFAGSTAEARKAADERAKQVTAKFFWAEWLASSGRAAEAASEVEKSDLPGAKFIAQGLARSDVATASTILRFVGAPDDPLRFTTDRLVGERLRRAAFLRANGKTAEGQAILQGLADLPALKGIGDKKD